MYIYIYRCIHILSSCLTANPATALQPGRFEDSSMSPTRLLWRFIFIECWVPQWCWICSYCAAWCNGHRNRLHFWRGSRVPKWYPGTSKLKKNEPSQVGLRIHFHWILHCRGIILVGPKGAKMMPRAPKKVPKWCPGSPKVKENEPRGTQRGTNEKKTEKTSKIWLRGPPPFWHIFAQKWETN